MFEKATIVNMFPIPVWAHALKAEDAEAVNRSALEAIEHLQAAANQPPQGAPWQSADDLHGLPELEALVGFIRGAAQGVLQNLQARCKGFRIASCWADVAPKGASPEGRSAGAEAVLAGIYCVKAGEGGSVVFHDPKPRPAGPVLEFAKPTPYNARNATVLAPAGTLLVFPAWLDHAVAPNAAAEDCVTVGFQIAVSAATGA